MISPVVISQAYFRKDQRGRTSACNLLFSNLVLSPPSMAVLDVSPSSADRRFSNMSFGVGSSSSRSFPLLIGGSLSRTTILVEGGGWVPNLSFIRLTVLGVGSGSGSSSSVSLIRTLPLLWFLARCCLRVSGDSTSDSSVKIALPLPLRLLAARVCGSWE